MKLYIWQAAPHTNRYLLICCAWLLAACCTFTAGSITGRDNSVQSEHMVRSKRSQIDLDHILQQIHQQINSGQINPSSPLFTQIIAGQRWKRSLGTGAAAGRPKRALTNYSKLWALFQRNKDKDNETFKMSQSPRRHFGTRWMSDGK